MLEKILNFIKKIFSCNIKQDFRVNKKSYGSSIEKNKNCNINVSNSFGEKNGK